MAVIAVNEGENSIMQIPEIGDALPRRSNPIWRVAGLGLLQGLGWTILPICRIDDNSIKISKKGVVPTLPKRSLRN